MVLSPKAKERLWLALRLIITGALILFILYLIDFQDTYRVRVVSASGEAQEVVRKDVLELQRAGATTTLIYADGTSSTHASGDVVKREGFFSLFGRADKLLYLLLLPAFLVPLFFQAFKWWFILRENKFGVSLGRTFLVCYASTFFNSFLAGAMGGDLARAVVVGSQEERKAGVAATVILDRAIGMGVLILMGAVCLTAYISAFEDTTLVYLVYGLLGGLVLGYFLYFSRNVRRWFGRLIPPSKILGDLDAVFRSAHENKRLLATVAGLSVPAQASAILLVYGLAHALHIEGVPLWEFFILMPVVFLVSALPISIGGWGIQESAYAYFFGAFAGLDPNQAIALSILYKLSQILVSAPGAALLGLGGLRKR